MRNDQLVRVRLRLRLLIPLTWGLGVGVRPLMSSFLGSERARGRRAPARRPRGDHCMANSTVAWASAKAVAASCPEAIWVRAVLTASRASVW